MNKPQTILVTGGAGYIGSHTCVELLDAGYNVVVVDNLCNSKADTLDRVQEITGKPLTFVEADLRDLNALDKVFSDYSLDAVIHFAGLKAVGESVEFPLSYYDNNVSGSINLLQAMDSHGVRDIVFSSSATVYGDPASLPITEDFPVSPTNPYGRTKLFIEEILQDCHKSNEQWRVAILRYFNPVGAHKSGKIGEDPNGMPNNLMPYISQVAAGSLKELSIFGDDYPTKDGTGVRDYIHVVDLAIAHVKTLEKLSNTSKVLIYNLGTGKGYSVLEMVDAFRKASGKYIPYKTTSRRAGDIASCYADATLAKNELDWVAKRDLAKMCEDVWRWQEKVELK